MTKKKPPVNEKRQRFARIFPSRVEKIVDQLRVLSHCSNKSSYEFDKDLVTRCWIEIARRLETTGKDFGINFKVTLDGKPMSEYDTSKPLKKTKRS